MSGTYNQATRSVAGSTRAGEAISEAGIDEVVTTQSGERITAHDDASES
jgi:hypothetical protein